LIAEETNITAINKVMSRCFLKSKRIDFELQKYAIQVIKLRFKRFNNSASKRKTAISFSAGHKKNHPNLRWLLIALKLRF
jgi:hypothetical protein